ncbi:hypothetical protein [Amycolatopsis panacis]|uniref:hypothetical protein n=1 Tax=Amycolatopsis panacis TaxID=2340917 RepID=UPI0011C3750E|nr:hypothetical protein [Amycolatopsis panacis]
MAAPRTPREVADWAASAQADLSKLLAIRETSTHRVMTVTESYEKLAKLSIKQDKLFREALQCAEHGLYRSAHVTSFAALMDFVHEWIAADPARLMLIQANYPSWNIKQAADFREQKDHTIFDVLKKQGLITNSMTKALQGLLAKRNECAHPEDYEPGINDTLGYLDEMMKRIAALMP